MGLAVDPLLNVSSSSLPQWPLPLTASIADNIEVAGPSVIVTEGIPPVSTKIVEKIHHWEYVDLGSLLTSQEVLGSNSSFFESGKEIQKNKRVPLVNNLRS